MLKCHKLWDIFTIINNFVLGGVGWLGHGGEFIVFRVARWVKKLITLKILRLSLKVLEYPSGHPRFIALPYYLKMKAIKLKNYCLQFMPHSQIFFSLWTLSDSLFQCSLRDDLWNEFPFRAVWSWMYVLSPNTRRKNILLRNRIA